MAIPAPEKTTACTPNVVSMPGSRAPGIIGALERVGACTLSEVSCGSRSRRPCYLLAAVIVQAGQIAVALFHTGRNQLVKHVGT